MRVVLWFGLRDCVRARNEIEFVGWTYLIRLWIYMQRCGEKYVLVVVFVFTPKSK